MANVCEHVAVDRLGSLKTKSGLEGPLFSLFKTDPDFEEHAQNGDPVARNFACYSNIWRPCHRALCALERQPQGDIDAPVARRASTATATTAAAGTTAKAASADASGLAKQRGAQVANWRCKVHVIEKIARRNRSC